MNKEVTQRKGGAMITNPIVTGTESENGTWMKKSASSRWERKKRRKRKKRNTEEVCSLRRFFKFCA